MKFLLVTDYVEFHLDKIKEMEKYKKLGFTFTAKEEEIPHYNTRVLGVAPKKEIYYVIDKVNVNIEINTLEELLQLFDKCDIMK